MIFFFTGHPASGKSTMSKQFARDAGFQYFSTGAYARALGMNPSEESIASRDLSLELDSRIVQRVQHMIQSGKNLVIDGYPRSTEQIRSIKSMGKPFYLFFVHVPILDMIERSKKRGREEETIEVLMGRYEAAEAIRAELKSLPGYVEIKARDTRW